MESLRQKIVSNAKKRGLNIEELSEKVGMSRNGFNKAFKEESLKIKTLERISEELQVPLSYWFVDELTNNQTITGNGNKQLINSVDYSNMEKDLASCLKENELLRNQLSDKDTIINLLKRTSND